MGWRQARRSRAELGYNADEGNAYINVESYPNVGTAVLTVAGATYVMNYDDWGDDASWRRS